jgi:hypothetical protein
MLLSAAMMELHFMIRFFESFSMTVGDFDTHVFGQELALEGSQICILNLLYCTVHSL